MDVLATFKSKEEPNNKSSPRATMSHLRVNKYSHWTKCVFFFFVFFFFFFFFFFEKI